MTSSRSRAFLLVACAGLMAPACTQSSLAELRTRLPAAPLPIEHYARIELRFLMPGALRDPWLESLRAHVEAAPPGASPEQVLALAPAPPGCRVVRLGAGAVDPMAYASPLGALGACSIEGPAPTLADIAAAGFEDGPGGPALRLVPRSDRRGAFEDLARRAPGVLLLVDGNDVVGALRVDGPLHGDLLVLDLPQGGPTREFLDGLVDALRRD